jgi:hypothetical protein
VSDTQGSSRRAERLVRWYPAVWRERYGVEFVELLKQEIDERPHDLQRSLNLAYRGSVARCRELGLASSTLNPADQPRAAAATVFVTSTVFVALALNFWAIAMLSWNSYWKAPASLAVTAWTGALTVLAGVVIALVVATFVAVLYVSVRRIVKGQGKRLITPLSLVISSVAVLLVATNNVNQYVIARGGIDWAHPGQAIKQLAGIAQTEVTTVNWIWMSPRESLTLFSNVLDAFIPIALLVLVFSVAVLVRRSNFSFTTYRSGRVALLVVVSAMALFVISYAGLLASNGVPPSWLIGAPTGYPPLILEFVTMVVMAALAVQCYRRLSKGQRQFEDANSVLTEN